jgi:hypothetical protein
MKKGMKSLLELVFGHILQKKKPDEAPVGDALSCALSSLARLANSAASPLWVVCSTKKHEVIDIRAELIPSVFPSN